MRNLKVSKEKELEFLKEEYFKLIDAIFHYDSLVFKIKTASLTVILTLLSIIKNFKDGVVLIVFLVLILWFIETVLKTFQHFNYSRAEKIESFMRGERDTIYLFQICNTFSKELKERFLVIWLKKFFSLHLAIPYIAIITTVLYFYNYRILSLLLIILFLSAKYIVKFIF